VRDPFAFLRSSTCHGANSDPVRGDITISGEQRFVGIEACRSIPKAMTSWCSPGGEIAHSVAIFERSMPSSTLGSTREELSTARAGAVTNSAMNVQAITNSRAQYLSPANPRFS
jgi:hypothetical protein